MGKIALYVFMLLVPMGGALEGTEGVVSGVPPTQTSPESSRTPDGPATVTGLDPLSAIPELVFPSGEEATIDIPVVSGLIAGTVILFIIISLIVWVCCCFAPPTKKLVRRRTLLDLSSTSSHDGDDNVPLSSDLAKAPEDALSIQGLSSANERRPEVKFRRGRPGSLSEPAVSSPPGDVLVL